MSKITIENLDVTVEARSAQSVLNTLLYEGQPIHTVCGGRARCGCCRIRILEGGAGTSPVNKYENVRLTPEEIAAGWRLACQTYILRDLTIYLPTGQELDAECSKSGH